MTGDYRSKMYGPMRRDARRHATDPRARRRDPIYGVLGNHDSIAFVPEFEAMGIRMLINESTTMSSAAMRGLALVGIDDHALLSARDIPKATADVQRELPSILLSHAPEVYRQAARGGVRRDAVRPYARRPDLPAGRISGDLDARHAAAHGARPWRRHGMLGYTSPGAGTSIVDVRINCPPEITLHRLRCVP